VSVTKRPTIWLVPSSETTLPSRAASVGAARRFLVRTLEGWELQGLDYDASVVLSELVTNAVLHAGTEISVRVSYDEGCLRLEVSDESPRMPVAKRRNPSAATGKGLVLVDALATEWGVRPEANGKTIWANFAEAAVLGTEGPTIRQLRLAGGGGVARGGSSPGRTPSEARAAS
jgi:anti-sigma regulatory factor (Ser/Thr protein kinase)